MSLNRIARRGINFRELHGNDLLLTTATVYDKEDSAYPRSLIIEDEDDDISTVYKYAHCTYASVEYPLRTSVFSELPVSNVETGQRTYTSWFRLHYEVSNKTDK